MNLRIITCCLLVFGSSSTEAWGDNLFNTYGYEGVREFEHYAGGRLGLVAKFLPENPNVFEAGAHYGEDSVVLAKTWPKGTVLSFEPNPHAFKMFLDRTKDVSNIQGYELAVGNYNGTATLYVCYGTNGNEPQYFDGASSLLVPSEGQKIHYQGPEVEVPCVILDDWCNDHGIDRLDFMWIDLEGMELQLLSASPEILKTVKVIYTETNFYGFREGTTQYADLKAFLEQQGFTVIAHWFTHGLQGDAVFVRNELLD